MKKTQVTPATVSTTTKYRELISKSDSQLKAEALDLKEAKAKSQVELALAQGKLDLANAKDDLNKAICADPYSLEAELAALEIVQDTERGVLYAEEVLANRF